MDYIGYYLMIGVLYTFINGAVRKMNTEGDWGLVLVWIIAWPIPLIALIISAFRKKSK